MTVKRKLYSEKQSASESSASASPSDSLPQERKAGERKRICTAAQRVMKHRNESNGSRSAMLKFHKTADDTHSEDDTSCDELGKFQNTGVGRLSDRNIHTPSPRRPNMTPVPGTTPPPRAPSRGLFSPAFKPPQDIS